MILQISFGDVSNIIQLWLPIAISVLSFILSICNAWKNKKVLDVEIEEEYSIISNVYKDDAAVLSNILTEENLLFLREFLAILNVTVILLFDSGTTATSSILLNTQFQKDI